MTAAAEDGSSELGISKRSNRSLIATIVSLTLIGVALYSTPDHLEHWHYILRRLFYFPIIVAGVAFGWKGGGAAALLSSTHT